MTTERKQSPRIALASVARVVRTLLVHRWGNPPHHVNLACAFCGKSQRETRKLVAGPTVYICDACIKVCHDLVSKETGESPTAQTLTKVAGKLGLELKRERRFALVARFLATVTNIGFWLRGRGAGKRSTFVIIPRTICRRAISLADELERLPSHEEQSSVTTKSQERGFCCSFCGQSQDEVLKLVAGPAVNICDDCINLCHDIIVEEYGDQKGRRHHLQGLAEKARRLALHLNNLSTVPRRISDRAGVLATDLERLATPDKAGD